MLRKDMGIPTRAVSTMAGSASGGRAAAAELVAGRLEIPAIVHGARQVGFLDALGGRARKVGGERDITRNLEIGHAFLAPADQVERLQRLALGKAQDDLQVVLAKLAR